MYDPIIADLHRCIDGKRGQQLLAAQQRESPRV
jgi:type IV secretion system protein VirD4